MCLCFKPEHEVVLCVHVLSSRDDKLLPEDVEVVNSTLAIQGPVGQQHGGLYECLASYHQLHATLQFNVTVKQPGGWDSLLVFRLLIWKI